MTLNDTRSQRGSWDADAGSEEVALTPTADPGFDDGPTRKRRYINFGYSETIKVTVKQGVDLQADVCIDAERIEGVYYNTVRNIVRSEQQLRENLDKELLDHDNKQSLQRSTNGLFWLLTSNVGDLNKEQRLVYMYARFESICNKLAAKGDSLSKIRSGTASITRQQFLQLLKDDHLKLFGEDDFFPSGETYLEIPQFSYFLKREELYYYGICQKPYEMVSVGRHKNGAEIAQAIILDGAPSLRTDMGTRFILYSQFEKSGSEINDYNDQNSPIFQSWIHEVPIRVVRAYNAVSRHAPPWGYRYDGLYRIIGVCSDNNKQGLRVWTYVLSKCDPSFEPPIYDRKEDFDLGSIINLELRSTMLQNVYIHARLQKAARKKLAEDFRNVSVLFKGERLFNIAVPNIVRDSDPSNKLPLVVNFALIYNHIKSICASRNLGKEWLEGPVEAYEKARTSKSDIWWARGGFLPMKLLIKYAEPSRAVDIELHKGQYKYKVQKKRIMHNKSLVINREMAKTMARPFFPQSDRDAIWTSIELVEPMPSTWDPYEDISAGAEIHPIPVVNTVDDDEPPMVFTYISSNIYFSRLPHLNFDAVCAGCVPETLDKEECQPVVLKGFCKGLMDSKGQTYCMGVNKSYLATIQSRAACSDNCPCSSACSNRLLEGVQVPVKLVKTANMGWALHCMVPISEGTYIMQYVGEIICRSEMMAREHQYDKLGLFNYCMEAVEMETLHDDWQMPCMDSMILGNIARFLNHSCDPNVEVITVWRGDDFPCISVYALRYIGAGEALTYCYGSQYKSIPCLCNANNCKGFIGNI
ncbi:histone-lysine N-methyltransferase suv39h domain containing protein [Babesia gibsoni]|uniref:Histone-lysine N-methyltransferase suv39h domain containing protein n=1 Tax=Babesia gibsoni TaxID=33632 RepID=A0AAD8LIR8_BABGI|nr:histone-lysine N-methyltransferase suv39h domain containing protein [Babesia gibsoni]